MARTFVAASSQNLEGTAPVTAVPCTFAAWMYKTDDAANLQGVAIGDVVGGGGGRLSLIYSATEVVQAQAVGVGGTDTASSSASGSLNAWVHGAAVFASSTSRTAYLNGGNAGSETSSNTQSGIDTVRIGQVALSGGAFGDGSVAEAAVWDIDLTAAEVAVLAKGVSPLFVRPANLVAYWPLIGRHSPEPDIVGGFNLTLTNVPANFAHPRVIYPCGPKITPFVAAASGRVWKLAGLGGGLAGERGSLAA